MFICRNFLCNRRFPPLCFSHRNYTPAILEIKNNENSLLKYHNRPLINNYPHIISQRFYSTDGLDNGFTSFQTRIFSYISESSATEYFKQYIITIHDTTGLPWWGSVLLSTFLLRTLLTFPLAIYQTNIISKVENITLLEMPEIAQDVQKETVRKAKQEKWTEIKAKLYFRRCMKMKWNELIIRDNCHPFKATITLWFQLPTWIFFSAALRNMAYMLPHQTPEAQILFMKLAVGGFLWIPNLTLPDGTLILPILLGLSNLAIIEIQAMMRLRKSSRIQRYATNFFRCFSVALIPISATVPSILCLYWTSSSLIGLCQNLLLMSNTMKKTFRIPDTPTTLDHPYRQLIYEIKQKSNVFTNFSRKKT